MDTSQACGLAQQVVHPVFLPEAAAMAGPGAGAAARASLSWQTILLSMVPILA